MKYFKYILLGFIFLLSVLFIRNDVVFTSLWMQLPFYALCFALNAVVVFALDQKKDLDAFLFFLLVANALLWSLTENLAFGLLLPFLIVMSRIKPFQISTTIIASLETILVAFVAIGYLFFALMTETVIEKTYNSPDEKIIASVVCTDGGAFGGPDYKLVATTPIIKNCIYLERRIAVSRAPISAMWINNNTIDAGYSQYTIKFP